MFVVFISWTRLTELTLNWSSKHLSPAKRRWAILKGFRIGGFMAGMKQIVFQEGNTALLKANNGGSPNGSNSSIPRADNNEIPDGNTEGIPSSSNTEVPVRSSSGILGRISPGILRGNNKVIPSDGTPTPNDTETGTEDGSGEITQGNDTVSLSNTVCIQDRNWGWKRGDHTRKRYGKLI